MALARYKSKRNFNESPEPGGGKSTDNKLHFVIQKHDASRLHYDFRLEIQGVLKSWAVPKGPSTDPAVKRLAMMVEDHPYDYRKFEGVIPSGYGAGTVIIWDNGFYEVANSKGMDKPTMEKQLRKGIRSGKIHFVLHGKKLKGEYALIKTHGQQENAWLLFKVKDKFVSKTDITEKNKSVISKKTLAQVEKSYSVLKDKEAKTKSKNPVQLKSKKEKKVEQDETPVPSIATIDKPAKFPGKVLPMLATLIDKPFDSGGWQYEIKWDGYRTIALCNKNKVHLRSRNNKSFNEKFYPVQEVLKELNLHAVLDGEVVILDKNGKSDFSSLQNWRSEADGDLYYYVFDILWLNGNDLMHMTLSERRNILKKIITGNGTIRKSESFRVSGIEFFKKIKQIGLEGIIAKRSNSTYIPGTRSKEWLKIKSVKKQEMVIGGYTKKENSPKLFSSLLLGVFEHGKLIYKGKAGTGFNHLQQEELLNQFKPLISKTCPFDHLPDINKPSRFRFDSSDATVVWMKPVLVCEVSYTEMTSDGVMRHPAFEAMRVDKKAKDVMHEKPKHTSEMIAEKKIRKEDKIPNYSGEQKDKPFLNTADETQQRKVNGHQIKFSHLNKIYWPVEKITKRDLINYYHQVAPYILPYLKNRPQSMNRHPNGITGESFYFKDVTDMAPSWIKTFKYRSPSDNRLRKYLVAKDEASLLYMATLGCIEMNPWHSRIKSEEYPDWCIIDLDPAGNTFNKVIEAAIITKDILESMNVISYPKTSGSTGIHIYIPLGAKYTYDQSKEFARIIATLIHHEIPRYTTIERIVKARKGKMYIDFLQNRPQATVAAPYSLRPKRGATVSMPLYWTEIRKGLKMKDFTIFNALERIKSEGDIFKPVLGKGINLEKILNDYTNG